MPDVREVVSFICLLAELGLVLRLWRSGLSRSYSALLLYSALTALQTIVWFASGFKNGTNAYWKFYLATTIPLIVFKIAIVVELGCLYAACYPGIRVLSRWAIVIFGGLAAVAATLAVLAPLEPHQVRGLTRATFFAMEYAGLALSLAAGAITLFGVWFREPLSRNAYRHGFILTTYFGVLSLGYLMLNFGLPKVAVSTAMLVTQTGCYLAWVALLSVAGERRRVVRPEEGQVVWPALDRERNAWVSLLKSSD